MMDPSFQEALEFGIGRPLSDHEVSWHRTQLLQGAIVVAERSRPRRRPLDGVRQAAIPSGYRQVQGYSAWTEKALRVTYYSWELWVPKKCALVDSHGDIWVQQWAIQSAKERAANHD